MNVMKRVIADKPTTTATDIVGGKDCFGKSIGKTAVKRYQKTSITNKKE